MTSMVHWCMTSMVHNALPSGTFDQCDTDTRIFKLKPDRGLIHYYNWSTCMKSSTSTNPWSSIAIMTLLLQHLDANRGFEPRMLRRLGFRKACKIWLFWPALPEKTWLFQGLTVLAAGYPPRRADISLLESHSADKVQVDNTDSDGVLYLNESTFQSRKFISLMFHILRAFPHTFPTN